MRVKLFLGLDQLVEVVLYTVDTAFSYSAYSYAVYSTSFVCI